VTFSEEEKPAKGVTGENHQGERAFTKIGYSEALGPGKGRKVKKRKLV